MDPRFSALERRVSALEPRVSSLETRLLEVVRRRITPAMYAFLNAPEDADFSEPIMLRAVYNYARQLSPTDVWIVPDARLVSILKTPTVPRLHYRDLADSVRFYC